MRGHPDGEAVADMIRFVVGPDGVVPDLKRKLPGRGIWITAARTTLADAIASNVFARGFKRDVNVDARSAGTDRRLLVARRSTRSPWPAKPAGRGRIRQDEAALERDEVVA